MKITVLNGSPKGNESVTMQYVHFIQKKFPEHELKILNISQKIKLIERDEKAFQEIIDEIKSSDGVLWAFPVYILLVPSQFKRFIELIWERGMEEVFKNKYTAALSTSKRVFDHTAHNYMNAICDDLNMRYVDFLSADMDDLLKKEERKKLILFAECFFEAIENNYRTLKKYKPLTYNKFEYISGSVEKKVDIGQSKIIIITDSEDKETNLGRMVERFKQSFAGEAEVFNLHDLDIKGGCLGCIQCWYDNKCVYQDDYNTFYQTKVTPADIVVFAGSIKDRYLSAKHKQNFDRWFINHHKPTLCGKQLGYLISGPAKQIHYLMDIFEANTEHGQNNAVGCITDECEDSDEIDSQLQVLAERLVRLAEKKYVRSSTYLGLGSTKIIRDKTWGFSRFIFQDDHRYFKENGLYDFPQKDYKWRFRNMIMIPLTKLPGFRKECNRRIKQEMIKPHQKIIATQ